VPQENFLLCHHSLHRILDFLLNLDYLSCQRHRILRNLLEILRMYHYLDFLVILVIQIHLDFLDFLDFPILKMRRHLHHHQLKLNCLVLQILRHHHLHHHQ
jgi:hypothetical protein